MKKRTLPIHFSPLARASIRIEKKIIPETKALRTHFETVFKNPLVAKSERFCWDYWTIPGQYRLLRTPADSFFPAPVYNAFLSQLLSWGRTHLGCQMISQPWLSAYVDGCFQNLHSDVPHGPFSFVYSLTQWKNRKFSGGETLVSKPRLLRYFSEVTQEQSHEEPDFFNSIPQPLGQLTVFDPRYPHGVRPVQGVESILDSRLVIHGWFTDPRPMLAGALTFRKILKPMDEVAHRLLGAFTSQTSHSGLFTLRLKISETGKIDHVTVLAAHLPDLNGDLPTESALKTLIHNAEVQFPRARSSSTLTLPLLIQR
jgi:hypothetical protein